MLFNSLEYILAFLPITLVIFWLLKSRFNISYSFTWLILASLFFYGWWNPYYLGVIAASILFNFKLGVLLSKNKSKSLLCFGLAANILSLAYFKYTNFLLENIGYLANQNFSHLNIILPLGISFFTFQKIAYLVDAYKGEVKEHNFRNFCLFVLFFPQLIAGPIVHHSQVIPQFQKKEGSSSISENIAIGLTIFAIGLFKKVFIADRIAIYSTPLFDAAAAGTILTTQEAWTAALAYSIQLYFDFSGYSDMAIGAARMFGIKLPLNFNSPYKAASIIDFWKHWHITLSEFLRNYVYIPLGGNRNGSLKRYRNLILTMTIGGIWHGASWNFVIWGMLHGMYLLINHVFRSVTSGLTLSFLKPLFLLTTFLSVVIAWVFFRSADIHTATSILSSMFGFSETTESLYDRKTLLKAGRFIGYTLLIIWLWPNTQQLMSKFQPALNYIHTKSLLPIFWKPTLLWAVLVMIVFIISLITTITAPVSEFLYFQF